MAILNTAGRYAKVAWRSLRRNKIVSEMVANGTVGSIGRWAMAGGAIGGIQGAARRVGGDQNASITGGVFSGMFAGAGARGFKAGWSKAFGSGLKKTPTVMPHNVPGMPGSSVKPLFSAGTQGPAGVVTARVSSTIRGRAPGVV